jgi:DNA-binding NarL/FixJ family response regulator
MQEKIRVLIADDHTLFREGLIALLDTDPDIEVVATARDGHQAIEASLRHQPDIILMDLQMPSMNGIQATRRIIQASPHIGVIVVTMFEDDDSVFAAMRAGARGYILKGADREDIIRAIQAVSRGDALFGPSIATRLMDFFARPAETPPPAFPELTDREREVLDCIAQGLNNTEIADRLFISPKTVRNHVSNIFNKMQVTDRVQAALRAREAGLGKDPDGF